MDLSWLESIFYGFTIGLTDILPISAEAHRLLLVKLFGVSSEPGLMRLFVHLAVFGALYYSCHSQILKIMRARTLAKIPKRKRKRPLDIKSLMDLSLWKTMLVPVIISFFFYKKAASLASNLIWMAAFMFLNGLLLYIPQFLPGCNKDSRMLSRVEGLLMGLGGAVAVLPGFSAIGASASIGSICGVERNYGLTMSMLMNLGLLAGLIVFDIMGLISGGVGTVSIVILLSYIVSALAALCGTLLGIKIMRGLALNGGFPLFAYYCWGVALFTFILNLMA